MVGPELEQACRESIERWGVPGVVVGVHTAGETDARAFGVADLAGGEPLRADQTFRVASITKPFTATLALALVADGLLALEAPAPLPLPAAGITLRHLLAHLGGLEGELGDLSRFGDGDDALSGAVAEVARGRVVVPPGRFWSYCNAGYWAVGAICAERLGTTYEEALLGRVLEPHGLGRTSFGEPEVTGHVQPEPGSRRHEPAPARTRYPHARRPSGGLVSTAPDLLRFASAHVRDERLARLREPQATTPSGAHGLGWALERIDGADIAFHRSAGGGFQTILALVPERDAAFTALTNGAGGDAVVRELEAVLLEALAGVRREQPPTAAVGRRELDPLAGSYSSGEAEARVDVDGLELVLRVVEVNPSTGERSTLPPLRARALGRRTFAVVGGQWEDERLDFVPGEGPPEFLRLGGTLVARL